MQRSWLGLLVVLSGCGTGGGVTSLADAGGRIDARLGLRDGATTDEDGATPEDGSTTDAGAPTTPKAGTIWVTKAGEGWLGIASFGTGVFDILRVPPPSCTVTMTSGACSLYDCSGTNPQNVFEVGGAWTLTADGMPLTPSAVAPGTTNYQAAPSSQNPATFSTGQTIRSQITSVRGFPAMDVSIVAPPVWSTPLPTTWSRASTTTVPFGSLNANLITLSVGSGTQQIFCSTAAPATSFEVSATLLSQLPAGPTSARWLVSNTRTDVFGDFTVLSAVSEPGGANITLTD
jgi:hypothetical protein